MSAAIATMLRYRGELHGFLLRRSTRKEDAEDVVQEVFLRILRLRDIEQVKSPRAYIYGIALHVVRELKMRDMRAGTSPTLDPQAIADLAEHPKELPQDDMADQLDIQRRLESTLMRLPAAHRVAFVMFNRDGYSYQEIARRMKVSVHTVDKYLLQAKLKIRTMEWNR